MASSPERIAYLLQAWTDRSATPEEEQELRDWVNGNPDEALVDAHIQKLVTAYRVGQEELPPVDWEALFQRILNARELQPATIIEMPRRKRWTWIAAAAAILAILGTGIYFWQQSGTTEQPPIAQTKPARDAQPGKHGAILTLADGSQVTLDSLANGTIAQQGNMRIILNNGTVVYNKNTDTAATAISYNTMSTPKGREYQLQLPDGTQVWLNAASSITYPTAFTNNERRVQITGEAYFEVAKDKTKPFRVAFATTSGERQGTVEVLGTHFNINTYDDEASAKTTLLEGSVKVTAGEKAVTIKPGDQAVLKASPVGGGLEGAGLSVASGVDLDQVMAWKNGRFAFNNADLKEVMRQLARWYDVEVYYEGNIPTRQFNGKIGKTLTLDQVLKGLTKTKVNYTIEGKRITIRP